MNWKTTAAKAIFPLVKAAIDGREPVRNLIKAHVQISKALGILKRRRRNSRLAKKLIGEAAKRSRS